MYDIEKDKNTKYMHVEERIQEILDDILLRRIIHY